MIHGDKLGRTIGYPTANVAMGDYLRPAYGIYAVRGRLEDGRVLQGAANLGIRPQFTPLKELLEPYFFDFAGDLYGQRIEVELVRVSAAGGEVRRAGGAGGADGRGLRTGAGDPFLVTPGLTRGPADRPETKKRDPGSSPG